MNKELTAQMIGMEKISPSALDCFEQCPRLFYYQNWLGLQISQDKMHMDFGTAIHEAIATIYSLYDYHFGAGWEPAEYRDLGIEKVIDTFLSKFTKHHIPEYSFQNYMKTRAGRESGFKSRDDLYSYMKKDGIAMLKSYWKEKEHLLAEYEHDLSEFEIPMKIDMVNPVDPTDKLPIQLSLRIDAVNRNRTKTVDFKTSGNKYDEKESRKKIQGQCYVYAQLMTKGVLIGKFDYIVLRKGLKSPDRIEVVQLEYDEADMVAFFQRVKSILIKIANREFSRPNIGHANWCKCFDYEEQLNTNI